MSKTKDSIIKLFIYSTTILTIIILFWIIGYIILNGISSFSPELFFGKQGIISSILTTLILIIISLLIATPVGIFSAIYLWEFAKPSKFISCLRFSVSCLAGIPSIIYGLFGFIAFVGYFKLGFSILSGALTLAIMILPTILSTTYETLKTIPLSYREASFALGATKVRTILKIVLPNALPGIITSIILSIGRIVGESAAIYLTVGTNANFPTSLLSSGRTLSVKMYLLAKEGISFDEAFFVATILIITVILINSLTHYVGKKLRGNT